MQRDDERIASGNRPRGRISFAAGFARRPALDAASGRRIDVAGDRFEAAHADVEKAGLARPSEMRNVDAAGVDASRNVLGNGSIEQQHVARDDGAIAAAGLDDGDVTAVRRSRRQTHLFFRPMDDLHRAAERAGRQRRAVPRALARVLGNDRGEMRVPEPSRLPDVDARRVRRGARRRSTHRRSTPRATCFRARCLPRRAATPARLPKPASRSFPNLARRRRRRRAPPFARAAAFRQATNRTIRWFRERRPRASPRRPQHRRSRVRSVRASAGRKGTPVANHPATIAESDRCSDPR